MTQLDLAVFLVAGVVGASSVRVPFANTIAWGIVGVWALLKLLKVV